MLQILLLCVIVCMLLNISIDKTLYGFQKLKKNLIIYTMIYS